MFELVPAATSRLANLAGIIGLDFRPYQWSVLGNGEPRRRGWISAGYMGRWAELELDSQLYSMRLDRRSLLGAELSLVDRDTKVLALASWRERSFLKYAYEMSSGPDRYSLSGGEGQFFLNVAGGRSVGSLRIERHGWTLRQSRAFLYLSEHIGLPVQLFVFWVCIHRKIDKTGGD